MEHLFGTSNQSERQEAEIQPADFTPDVICLSEIVHELSSEEPDLNIIRPFATYLARQNTEDLRNPLQELLDSHGEAITKRVLERIDTNEAVDELLPEKTANYQGSHTLVQFLRMSSPDFKHKFAQNLLKDVDDEPAEPKSILERQKTSASEQQQRIDNLDKNLARVYNVTGYAPAEKYEKKPLHIGISPQYGKPGVVFSDAENKGEPLTDRQKDIINAHENHHAIVLPERSDSLTTKLRYGLDFSIMNLINQEREMAGEERVSPKYLMHGSEIAARMAQIKNYFGMTGGEVFTKEHLDYARQNYVNDTGLDNSMSHLFAMITPETELDFIDNMNSLPI